MLEAMKIVVGFVLAGLFATAIVVYLLFAKNVRLTTGIIASFVAVTAILVLGVGLAPFAEVSPVATLRYYVNHTVYSPTTIVSVVNQTTTVYTTTIPTFTSRVVTAEVETASYTVAKMGRYVVCTAIMFALIIAALAVGYAFMKTAEKVSRL